MRTYGVIAELRDASGVTHTLRASGEYTRNKRVDIELRFDEACRGLVCGASQTCEAGSCVDLDSPLGCTPVADAGVDAAPSLPTPMQRFPWNGDFTGSVHVPASRMPTFSWSRIEGATSYELQVSDECSPGSFDSCAFAMPAVSVETSETSITLAEPLDVSESPPVGRRYHWRVRACGDDGCSLWSSVRYVDVARLRNDFDGDGYSDLLISAPRIFEARGEVYLFRGGPEGLAAPTTIQPRATTLGPSSWFGTAVGAVGDVDADGYPDAGVGANSALELGAGLAAIYRGGPGGIVNTREQLIASPDDPAQTGPLFGDEIAGVGDPNADGFADVIVGARAWNGGDAGEVVREGRVFFYTGSATSLGSLPAATFAAPDPETDLLFGVALGAAGDVNGDGLHDLVLATQYADVPDPGGGTIEDEGSAYVYLAPHRTESVPTRLVSGLYQAPSGPMSLPMRFGIDVSAARDLDGDGYGDLLIGAGNATLPGEAVRAGAVFVFGGGASGIEATARATLANPRRVDDSDFGVSVRLVGDLDGDGHLDVAVGDSANGSPAGAAVFVYFGTATGLESSPTMLTDPGAGVDSRFGAFLGGGGDIDGDGFDELVVVATREPGATTTEEGAVYVYFGRADRALGSPTILTSPSTPTDRGGLFGDEIAFAE